jgi:hypothetical protein
MVGFSERGSGLSGSVKVGFCLPAEYQLFKKDFVLYSLLVDPPLNISSVFKATLMYQWFQRLVAICISLSACHDAAHQGELIRYENQNVCGIYCFRGMSFMPDNKMINFILFIPCIVVNQIQYWSNSSGIHSKVKATQSEITIFAHVPNYKICKIVR